MSEYSKLLSMPEWKAFSNSIRQARANTCECCRLGGRVTQVHHLFYDGRKPWEYESKDVVLLCVSCHSEMHKELDRFRRFIFRKLKPNSFRVLNGALAVAMDAYDPLVFAHALAEFVSNPNLIQNHAKAWNES